MGADDIIQKSDIGVTFRVTVKDAGSAVDISSATTKQILLEKPDGTLLTKTASFTTDGTDGKIEYVSVSGDIDTIGRWKIQAKVVTSSATHHTSIGSFYVEDNLS